MKQQSMKQRMRLISALLALILCLLSCPLYATAEVGESMGDVILPSSTGSGLSSPVEDASALTWTPNDLFLLEAGDKPLSELAEMTLDASSLPEGLSYEQAVASGHVNRVREQEPDLNTVTFQNTNGTKTAYVYTKPVKYIDEMGVVRDKSSAITQQANGGYAMLDNSVKAYFPKNISAGVCIEYEDYSVTMRPITTGMLVPTQSYTEGRVVYANVFGAATLLSYQTTLDGIKEDIILVKNTGQNEFSFMLTLDGVTPVCVDGVWYVKDAENRIIGSFGEVIVKDSAGKTVKGSMTVAQANNASTYTLTVTVPEEYLQAADTQYPVYVDPTMNVYESELYYEWSDENNDSIIGYYDAIVDIGMNTNLGDSFELRPNNSSGVIYLLHDFYGQYAKYADMPYYQIGNVKMHLTKKSGADVDLAAFVIYDWMDGLMGTTDDGEPIDENLTYNETSQDYYCILFPQLFDLNNPDGAGELTDEGGWVDITYIAKEWAKFDFDEYPSPDPARGLVLFANSTTDSATIYSTEASGNTNVYYTIDYASHAGERYIYNDASGKFINAPTESSTPAKAKATYDDGYNAQWLFEYVGNDQYIIRSVANPNYALCSSNTNVGYVCYDNLANDTGDGRFYWSLGYHGAIGSYLFHSASTTSVKVLSFSVSRTDIFIDTIEKVMKVTEDGEVFYVIPDSAMMPEMSMTMFSTSVYVPVSSLLHSSAGWVAVGGTRVASVQTVPGNATLKKNTCFTWSSNNPAVATVDSQGVITGVSDGFAIISAKYNYAPDGDQIVKIMITVGHWLENGTYYIQNKETNDYLETVSGAIQTADLNNGLSQRWNVTYQGNGYYYIQSATSNQYMTVLNGSVAEGVSITQTATPSDASLWRIEKMPSEALQLIPKTGKSADRCLAIPTSQTTADANCIQGTYAGDEEYHDEWRLANYNITMNVNAYISEGYVYRYGSFEAASARVDNIFTIIQGRVSEYFNIHLTYSIVSTPYHSLADECGNPDSPVCEACASNPCTGTGNVGNWENYPYHHRNFINNFSNFTTLASSDFAQNRNNAIIGFMGHNCCKSSENGTCEIGQGGFSAYNSGVCLINYFADEKAEIATTLHEILHLFNAPDHYDLGIIPSTSDMNMGNPLTPYHEFCIYGERNQNSNVRKNLIICNGCQTTIRNHIQNNRDKLVP